MQLTWRLQRLSWRDGERPLPLDYSLVVLRKRRNRAPSPCSRMHRRAGALEGLRRLAPAQPLSTL